MEQENSFYRIELDDEQVPVSFDEIQELRKDILLYFDENIGEKIWIFLPYEKLNKHYWKYVSIFFKEEWAESVRYKKLLEEGCLAILNGIALELLDQPISTISKMWFGVDVKIIYSYINGYTPSSEKLEVAKQYLLESYKFILESDSNDIDGDGMLVEFNPAEAGEWFDREIVQAYYKWKLESVSSK